MDRGANRPSVFVGLGDLIALVAKTLLGRVGVPSDIAATVAFVVSADAGWVTGTTIDVAGGMVF